jgi:mannose-6-phosphate isomerase-like protein (cupin superfamily)
MGLVSVARSARALSGQAHCGEAGRAAVAANNISTASEVVTTTKFSAPSRATSCSRWRRRSRVCRRRRPDHARHSRPLPAPTVPKPLANAPAAPPQDHRAEHWVVVRGTARVTVGATKAVKLHKVKRATMAPSVMKLAPSTVGTAMPSVLAA